MQSGRRTKVKILLVVNTVFFSEPLGAMAISAICKEGGHTTRMAVLKKGNLMQLLNEFEPDIIGYSVMTPDVAAFIKADVLVRSWDREVRPPGPAHHGRTAPHVFPEHPR